MGSIGPSPAAPARESRLKTIDWGSNGITISMDQQGTILQLSFYHPKHGVAVLSPYEQFDGTRFYDPSYVRFYRARMLESIHRKEPGYGIQVHGTPTDASMTFCDRRESILSYTTQEGVHVRRVTSLTGKSELTQTTILSTDSPQGVSTAVTLNLGMSLNRASYGQLTEGGPVPIPESMNCFTTSRSGSTFRLSNPNLGASVAGTLVSNCSDCMRMDFDDSDQVFRNEPVKAESTTHITVRRESPVILTLKFSLHVDNAPVTPLTESISTADRSSAIWKLRDPAALAIIRGNLEYVLGNCMIPISEESTCVITDHVALPLGWNRDNYWQIRFLLEAYQKLDKVTDTATLKMYQEEIHRRVKGHLNWVFRDAQRPHGFWHRSYLATGAPKDGPIFQLDQQCYPFLELADFFDTIPDCEPFVRDLLRETATSEVVSRIIARQQSDCSLFPTDETPGDDPVEFPFHFSSHVLLWYTFTRLAKLLRSVGDTDQLQAAQLEELAQKIFTATMSHFVAENPKTSEVMFAYLTNGAGKHTFYHDANDIPTLFAPEWGFTRDEASIQAWVRTMKFGLSRANEGGYYGDGPFGGLGSVHTRGPWPLGYFQELVFAEMQGDLAARKNAWERIKGSMFSDGLFSEAVDCQTGVCTSKAWFSWPGSMIGCALLQDRAGLVFC